MIREISSKIIGLYERLPIIGHTTKLVRLDVRKILGNNTVSGCGLTTMPRLGESLNLRRAGFGNTARECLSMRSQSGSKSQRGVVYGFDGGENYTCSERDCVLFDYHNLHAVTKRVFPNK